MDCARQPEHEDIAPGVRKTDGERAKQHTSVLKGARELDMTWRPFFRFFDLELLGNPSPFLGLEPRSVPRMVRQVEERHNAQEDRGQAFKNKNPSPPGKLEPVEAENQSRNGSAQCQRDGYGNYETCHGPGAIAAGKPMRQINDYTRVESGLRNIKVAFSAQMQNSAATPINLERNFERSL